MRRISSCKRGNYTFDVSFIILFFFLFAIVAIVGKVIITTIDDMGQGIEELPDTQKQQLQDFDDGYVSLYDGVYLFAFIILVLALFFSAYLIDTHPIFFIIAVVLMVIFAVVNMLLRNVFFDLFSDDILGVYASQFTIIPFLMEYIVTIMLVVAAITGVILYAKLRGSEA